MTFRRTTQTTRLAGALGLVAGLSGCTQPDSDQAAPPASASAPAALSTTWQTDPGRLLTQGDRAPDFEALAHNGQRVRLSTFLDKPVVVYFYAGNDAPNSSVLAKQVRDIWLELRPHVSMVLGVSGDQAVVHVNFATDYGLPFLLISDPDNAVRRAFGVRRQSLPATFVVRSDSTIAAVLENTPAGEYGKALKSALAVLD